MELPKAKIKMKSIFEYLLRTHAGVSKAFSNILPAKPIPFTASEREQQLTDMITEASEVLNNIVFQLVETNLNNLQIDAIKQIIYAITSQDNAHTMSDLIDMQTVECPTVTEKTSGGKKKKLTLRQKHEAKKEGTNKHGFTANLDSGTEQGVVETSYVKRAILKMDVQITEAISVAIEKRSPHPNDFPIPTAIHTGILEEVKKLQTGKITKDNIGKNRLMFHQVNCSICELGIQKLHVQRNGTVHIRPRALKMICAAHIPWPQDASTKFILDALFSASSTAMEES
jgi:hypothetical protein